MGAHSQKAALYKPGKETSPETNCDGILILDSSPQNYKKTNISCLSHPSLCYGSPRKPMHFYHQQQNLREEKSKVVLRAYCTKTISIYLCWHLLLSIFSMYIIILKKSKCMTLFENNTWKYVIINPTPVFVNPPINFLHN